VAGGDDAYLKAVVRRQYRIPAMPRRAGNDASSSGSGRVPALA